ncbi:probable basic-leucine zipper transcription factor S [Abrus precatorius]|uniref:Probable basic-leucine zipper transcription factor S n=1 Tax=Abrus precatorius TaxID=3816 RepID=A0A8B8KHJ8_ABRPR|nr:probable basic-leucine zipper transcription factor S [Abrus precatorius]
MALNSGLPTSLVTERREEGLRSGFASASASETHVAVAVAVAVAEGEAHINNDSRPVPHAPKKKVSHWTEEEHRLFLQGLKRFGKGDWKSISRYSVVSKTSAQVASHAQKYFLRHNNQKKRKSIHDITTDNDSISVPPSEIDLVSNYVNPNNNLVSNYVNLDNNFVPSYVNPDNNFVPNYVDFDLVTNYTSANSDLVPNYVNPNNDLVPNYVNPNNDLVPNYVNPNNDLVPNYVNPNSDLVPNYVNPNSNLVPNYTNTNSDLVPNYVNPNNDLVPNYVNPNTNLVPNYVNPNSDLVLQHVNHYNVPSFNHELVQQQHNPIGQPHQIIATQHDLQPFPEHIDFSHSLPLSNSQILQLFNLLDYNDWNDFVLHLQLRQFPHLVHHHDWIAPPHR